MNVNVNLTEKHVIQINGEITINVDVIVKNIFMWKKYFLRNPPKCICENGKYLVSIRDDSTIICSEVIKPYEEEIKTISANFNEKKVTCKAQNVYILLAFLLITITLLIVVRIYCYVIKYQTKYLLLFHNMKR